MSHAASRTAPTRDAYADAGPDRAAFAKVRNAETSYARRLRAVAKQIEELVRAFASAETGVDFANLAHLLERYANVIEPWARAVANRFVAEIAQRDEKAWASYAKSMSRELQREIREAPTGFALQRLLDQQVSLITSLPLKAAQRVHEIAVGNLYGGARYGEMVNAILESGDVARSRATMIARTETARASSLLTQVRAVHVGSDGYIWRTVRDRRVRSTHRHMEGKFVRWDSPPVVDPGVPPYHAGQVWNCRCFPETVIPDRYMPGKTAA